MAAFKHRCGLVPAGLRVAARGLLVAAFTLSGLASSTASAADFDTELSAAREAVAAQDADALAKIEAADAAAISGDRVVLARQAASLDFYRGVLHWQAQETDAAMDAWRRALIIDPTYAPDAELLTDVDALDLIEALRSETQQKEMRAPGVDEASPGVRVYVSGQLMHSYDLIYAGRQLVQVLCPDGTLRGWWHVYGDAPDYAGACSLPQPDYTAFAAAGSDTGKPPRASKEDREPRESNPALLGYGLVGGGVAALGAGIAVQQLQVKPAYAEIEAARAAPSSVTRAQADQLSADFGRARWISLGLIGVGTVAVGAGAAQLTVGPQGVALTGEF